MSINLKAIVISSAFLLMSCGSGGGGGGGADPSADPSSVEEVETEKTSSSSGSWSGHAMALDDMSLLGDCTGDNQGQLVYIISESKFKVCSSGSWADISIKGDKGDTGTAGTAGTDGTSISAIKAIDYSAENFCSWFSTDECYFRGGQIVEYSDGTVQIVAGMVYRYAYSNAGDTDTDIDESSATFVLPASYDTICVLLSTVVSRGSTTPRKVYYKYTRSPESIVLVYDTDNDAQCEETDETIFTATITNL